MFKVFVEVFRGFHEAFRTLGFSDVAFPGFRGLLREGFTS